MNFRAIIRQQTSRKTNFNMVIKWKNPLKTPSYLEMSHSLTLQQNKNNKKNSNKTRKSWIHFKLQGLQMTLDVIYLL